VLFFFFFFFFLAQADHAAVRPLAALPTFFALSKRRDFSSAEAFENGGGGESVNRRR